MNTHLQTAEKRADGKGKEGMGVGGVTMFGHVEVSQGWLLSR